MHDWGFEGVEQLGRCLRREVVFGDGRDHAIESDRGEEQHDDDHQHRSAQVFAFCIPVPWPSSGDATEAFHRLLTA